MNVGDSSDEILEFAISREMESHHFYLALVEEEVRHELRFQAEYDLLLK